MEFIFRRGDRVEDGGRMIFIEILGCVRLFGVFIYVKFLIDSRLGAFGTKALGR